MASDGTAQRVVEAVHARNGQQLHGFAIRLGLRDDEAADVAQEALLRLFRSLARGDVIDEPAAWTFRTAYRLAMDRHRFTRRWRAIAVRLAPPEPATHADDLIAVWTEVDALPPRQRAALYLRYRSDLTFEAIGMVLDIDASSARANVSRGVARLRARLKEQ